MFKITLIATLLNSVLVISSYTFKQLFKVVKACNAERNFEVVLPY